MRKTERRSMTLEELKQFNSLGWEIVNYELEKTERLVKDLAKECAYAYCYHNKDLDKQPHVHLLLIFPVEKTGQDILDMCASHFEENVRIEPITNKQKAYEYLIHKNDPYKWQYSNSERVTNNARCFKGMNSSVATNDRLRSGVAADRKPDVHELIDDLLDGKLSRVEMAKKYGRDYIRNMTKYDDFKRAVALENQLDFAFLDNVEYRAYRIMKESGDVISSEDLIDPKYLNSSVFALALKLAQEIMVNNHIRIGELQKE